jgi:hypothetical protein
MPGFNFLSKLFRYGGRRGAEYRRNLVASMMRVICKSRSTAASWTPGRLSRTASEPAKRGRLDIRVSKLAPGVSPLARHCLKSALSSPGRTCESVSRFRLYRHGWHQWHDTASPMMPGNASKASSPSPKQWAGRLAIGEPSSMASSGSFAPAQPGGISPRSLAPGRPSGGFSMPGTPMAP